MMNIKAGFLDPRGGGKKINKQGAQATGNKKNNNGLSRSILDYGFPPLVDVTSIVHVQSGIQLMVGLWDKILDVPTSYANKLSLTLVSKANLQKLDVNVPNDADFDIWLPLASVHKENDKIKNSLYGYFIGKRLDFPVFKWFLRSN
ncbi:hypothetical protein Tco_1558628 [Tanacetum coccineum]